MKGFEVQAFMQAYNRGDYPHQRLGQAFINTHGHDHCDHGGGTCLFYQENAAKAAKEIWERITE